MFCFVHTKHSKSFHRAVRRALQNHSHKPHPSATQSTPFRLRLNVRHFLTNHGNASSPAELPHALHRSLLSTAFQSFPFLQRAFPRPPFHNSSPDIQLLVPRYRVRAYCSRSSKVTLGLGAAFALVARIFASKLPLGHAPAPRWAPSRFFYPFASLNRLYSLDTVCWVICLLDWRLHLTRRHCREENRHRYQRD